MNKDFEEFSKIFREAMEANKKESEDFYESLSMEDKLKVFCAVTRRIFQGELEDCGSYRYVLYNVFGFGPEAYAQAQDAGYLALHNAIYDGATMDSTLKKFATEYLNYDKGDLDDQIYRFKVKRYY